MTESIVAGSATRAAVMLRDVRHGLGRLQKELPPKYFYDTRGSELFEEITRLPEYYLTRVERSLLEQTMPRWMSSIAPRSLVELGAGSAAKTRLVLEAMLAVRANISYIPVDVSAEFLAEMAERLREEYQDLEVRPAVADFTEVLELPRDLPRPALHAFLGSTIGNFDDPEATRILHRMRRSMADGDHVLLGVDLQKDVARIERAYNDSAGVTAEFNLNILHVLNRELGADFDVASFEHLAFYDPRRHRIEMHLVATRGLRVEIPGAGQFALRAGESIRTEISCKYDHSRVRALCAAAGLRIGEWITDPERLYALVLARSFG